MMPIITIIGPYDYGKSTLLGNLLLKTGSIPKNLVKNVKAQCVRQGVDFHPSYLIDYIREEQDMKSTRERALAELKIGSKQILIIDTPGQLSLSQKMISGLTEANVVVLMLDILDENVERYAFYFKLLSLLNIGNVILAINKMDMVGYSQKNYKDFLKKISEKCELKKEYYILPVAALLGDNLVKKSSKMVWYKKASLFEHLKKIVQTQEKTKEKGFLLPVQSVIEKDGRSVVLGKIIQGALTVGSGIKINSHAALENSKVEELYVDGKKSKKALENENVGVCLSGEKKIKRGDLIVGEKTKIGFSQKMEAWFFVTKDFKASSKNLELRMFTDTQRIMTIKIKKHINFQDKIRGNKTEKVLRQNEFVEAELVLKNKIMQLEMDVYESAPKLAIVDSKGNILAVGEILQKNGK